MAKKYLIFIFGIFGIFLLPLNSLKAQAVEFQWNTFLGCVSDDECRAIALDNSGNIYICGKSDTSWGTPINAHSGGYDVFVAKLGSSGNLIWNTFLGSIDGDHANDIALDGSGNIYVIGYSETTWGSPINAHSGDLDGFVACLDSSGNLTWNTFFGSTSGDVGRSIALDSSENIYLTGSSYQTWGSPLNAHNGGDDILIACLDNSGNLAWHTFLGSYSGDWGFDIGLDSSGNIFVTGWSYQTWGSPINSHGGGSDAFALCLNNSGNLLWNTFLGSSGQDYCRTITLDDSANIYLAGFSYATWGSPINPYNGGVDTFLACLDSSGNLLWNTFFGSSNNDRSHDITLDESENIYVTGYSNATWGSPLNPHSGGNDAYVTCMNSSGNLLWNTFLGNIASDVGQAITLDSSGNIFVTGWSYQSWGSPINAHSGENDAFVAKLTTYPIPDIKANGTDGPVSITQSDILQIRVSLATYGITDEADFWLAYKGPSGWVHYNNSTKKWEPGLGVTHQGPLFDVNNKKVFQSSGLSVGTYRFYFGVDMNMNGSVTKSSLYSDMVKVTVTSD